MRPTLAILLVMALSAATANAAIIWPYTADVNTVHLWHFDEADPGPALDTGSGTALSLSPENGAFFGAGGYLGSLGLGTCIDTAANPYAGLRSSVTVPVSDYTGADGAFTIEALIRTSTLTGLTQMVVCSDNNVGGDARPFQWRINGTTMNFIEVSGGTVQGSATIPTTGTNANVTATSTLFGPIDNPGTADDFTGGLTVDTNGFAVTYGNVLLGATGNGVKQGDLAVTGGSGYIGAPLVQFTGGTLAANGTPAAGYAVISGGAVTGIVITSPGTYTDDPTVTLTGGGGTGASVALSALTANAADSGLTKINGGTLQVNNTNTAAGTDVVLTLPTAANLTVGSLSGTIATPTSGANTGPYIITVPGAGGKLVYATTIGTNKASIMSTVSPFGVTGTRLRKTMGAMGDSISNDMPAGLHFAPQAAYLMDQRCQAEVSYAVSGNTTANMVANQLPQAVRSGLDIVVIHGGVNDITIGVAAVDIEANIQTMAEGLLGVGIKPVLSTVMINRHAGTGWDAAKFAVWTAVNTWIRAYAAATPGVLLADFALACIDIPEAPDLPAWKTGHSTDLVHPTYPGYWAMADALATLLLAQPDCPASIRPTAALAALPSVVTLTNPLMTGILGASYGDAVTGARATNWMTQYGDAGTTAEKAARTDGLDGEWQVLNVAEGDTDLVLRYGTVGTPSITLTPGTYRFFAEVDLSGATWATGTLAFAVLKLSGDGTLVTAPIFVVTEAPTTGTRGIIRSQPVVVSVSNVGAAVMLTVGAFVGAVKVGAVWAEEGTFTGSMSEGEWNQAGSGNWSVGNPGGPSAPNWNNYKPTVAGDAALYGSAITGPATIAVDAPHTVGYMRFDNATNSYTIGAAGSSNLTLDNGASAAAITGTSGSHIIAENILLNSNLNVSPASGTTLTVSGNLSGAGGVEKKDAGELVLSGANAYIGATKVSSGTLSLAGSLTGGGAITVSGTAVLAEGSTGVISGAASITHASTGTSTLSGANAYTGTTTVNGGTLLINSPGSLNVASAVTVNTGGTLGGDGTINGAVTVNTGGTLSPGAGAGTLQAKTSVAMAMDSTYTWQFDGTTADKVVITGGLTLISGWNLALVAVGGVPAFGSTYDLFTYTGAFTGSFVGDIISTPSGWPTATFAQDETSTPKRIYLSFGKLGDTNNDGVVDAADFITLKKNFGKSTGAGVAAGDFDKTGTVNWADLSILMSAMGPASPAATAPEPCSAMLLAFGAAALLRRKRKA